MQDSLGETFTGGILKFGTANFPIRLGDIENFFIGTSLLNIHALNKNAVGFGFCH